MEDREKFIKDEVHKHYEDLNKLGFGDVFAIFLQGSQNYGMDEYTDEYKSDVDTKAIIVPSLDEILSSDRKPYSSVYVREDNSHIDIKDVRTMFEMFKKQNTSYIELLFTDYYIVNPKYQKFFDELMAMREDIARYNTNLHLTALCGSAHNKFLAMTHISPHSEEKIKKFGYDPKELHHLMRYLDLEQKYIKGCGYKECLTPSDPEFLMNVKKGKIYTSEEAIKVGQETDERIKELRDKNLITPDPINTETGDKLNSILRRILIYSLKSNLKNEEN